MKTVLLLAVATGLAGTAMAAPLSSYTNVMTYGLLGSESSGVTYSRDTDTLYVIGDEGGSLGEVSKTGVGISYTAIGGFSDSEGVAYMGLDAQGYGRFLVADERIQKAGIITYTKEASPRTNTHLNFVPSYTFGPSVGNVGLEGVSYDHLTNTIWGVKETGPQLIYRMDISEGSGNVVTNPFDPISLGLNDLSDIYMMSNSLAFAGTDREWNLLVISQESKRILELTRTGEIVGSLDLSQFTLPKNDTIEGITMDDAGTLYLVAEGGSKSLPSHLYVLSSTAIPEPSTYALMALGCLGLWAFHRRQRNRQLS